MIMTLEGSVGQGVRGDADIMEYHVSSTVSALRPLPVSIERSGESLIFNLKIMERFVTLGP